MAPEVMHQKPYDKQADIWSYAYMIVLTVEINTQILHQFLSQARKRRLSWCSYINTTAHLSSIIDDCFATLASVWQPYRLSPFPQNDWFLHDVVFVMCTRTNRCWCSAGAAAYTRVVTSQYFVAVTSRPDEITHLPTNCVEYCDHLVAVLAIDYDHMRH